MRTNTSTRHRTTAENVVGLSSVVLLALALLPGWGAVAVRATNLGELGRLPGATGHFNAFYGYGWSLQAAVAVAVVAGTIAIARRFKPLGIPRLLYLLAGVAVTAGVLIALVRGPAVTGFNDVPRAEVRRGPLIGAALIPSLAMTAAGVNFAHTQRPRRRRRRRR